MYPPNKPPFDPDKLPPHQGDYVNEYIGGQIDNNNQEYDQATIPSSAHMPQRQLYHYGNHASNSFWSHALPTIPLSTNQSQQRHSVNLNYRGRVIHFHTTGQSAIASSYQMQPHHPFNLNYGGQHFSFYPSAQSAFRSPQLHSASPNYLARTLPFHPDYQLLPSHLVARHPNPTVISYSHQPYVEFISPSSAQLSQRHLDHDQAGTLNPNDSYVHSPIYSSNNNLLPRHPVKARCHNLTLTSCSHEPYAQFTTPSAQLSQLDLDHDHALTLNPNDLYVPSAIALSMSQLPLSHLDNPNDHNLTLTSCSHEPYAQFNTPSSAQLSQLDLDHYQALTLNPNDVPSAIALSMSQLPLSHLDNPNDHNRTHDLSSLHSNAQPDYASLTAQFSQIHLGNVDDNSQVPYPISQSLSSSVAVPNSNPTLKLRLSTSAYCPRNDAQNYLSGRYQQPQMVVGAVPSHPWQQNIASAPTNSANVSSSMALTEAAPSAHEYPMPTMAEWQSPVMVPPNPIEDQMIHEEFQVLLAVALHRCEEAQKYANYGSRIGQFKCIRCRSVFVSDFDIQVHQCQSVERPCMPNTSGLNLTVANAIKGIYCPLCEWFFLSMDQFNIHLLESLYLINRTQERIINALRSASSPMASAGPNANPLSHSQEPSSNLGRETATKLIERTMRDFFNVRHHLHPKSLSNSQCSENKPAALNQSRGRRRNRQMQRTRIRSPEFYRNTNPAATLFVETRNAKLMNENIAKQYPICNSKNLLELVKRTAECQDRYPTEPSTSSANDGASNAAGATGRSKFLDFFISETGNDGGAVSNDAAATPASSSYGFGRVGVSRDAFAPTERTSKKRRYGSVQPRKASRKRKSSVASTTAQLSTSQNAGPGPSASSSSRQNLNTSNSEGVRSRPPVPKAGDREIKSSSGGRDKRRK